MKVYLELPVQSRGIGRVRDALVRYKPSLVDITLDPTEADLTIIHVIGRHDRVEKQVNALKAAKKPYAMIQYCLRSTMKPKTTDWLAMWKDARVVWSYYDLEMLIAMDTWRYLPKTPFPFYYAPLGVDTDVFYDEHFKERQYIIINGSQNFLSESTKECYYASRLVNKKMLYLGQDLGREGVDCINDLSDEELAMAYSQSIFVSGLRRTEGFELPVIEGLMCGARPIVFDRPEMRKWFDGLALFIPEEPREHVIDKLTKLFLLKDNPTLTVLPDELALAKERFNWQTIIDGFWARAL